MNKKKILMYITILTIILFISSVGILGINRNKKIGKNVITEYVPEQEITDEQMRQTNVLLYFYDKNICSLSTEIRRIDSKQLINNPEKHLIELLISGPKNNNLSQLIPNDTELNNINIDKGILYIDFSEKFIDVKLGEEMEKNLIESILKTVTQLNEIKGIKILINGEEGKSFLDSQINFNEIFYLL